MNKIHILGANGNRLNSDKTTCIQIDTHSVIDAGNLLDTKKHNIKINNIFLTHSHLDHILDIPFLADATLTLRDRPLKIYGLPQTITAIKKHIFNWTIWPNFEEIASSLKGVEDIILIPLKPNKTIQVDNVKITPFLANHTIKTCGYMVEKNGHSFIYSGDTSYNKNLWNMINTNKNVKSLIVDVSFPSHMQELADSSKHFTPTSLQIDMNNHLKRKDLSFFITHLKPLHVKQIQNEMNEKKYPIKYAGCLQDGDYLDIKNISLQRKYTYLANQSLKSLNKIGKALSYTTDLHKFLNFFTKETMKLTNADGGTLYLYDKINKMLTFEIVKNRSLKIDYNCLNMPKLWHSLPLFLENGQENVNMVATSCAISKRPIFIDDIYSSSEYDFKGTKNFDKNTNYNSRSMMCIPLLNHEKNVIGVLQLINKISPLNTFIPFTKDDEEVAKSLGSQIAVLLSNSFLVKELEHLLESFFKSITTALNAKSAHTYTHINKMVKLSNMFVEKIHKDKTVFKDVNFSQDMKQVMRFSALLHDIGKLSTPERILNKATKLENVIDKIKLVRLRFEDAKKSAKIQMLENILSGIDKNTAQNEYQKQIKQIDDDFNFIEYINKKTQDIHPHEIQKVQQIGKKSYIDNGKSVCFLTKDELESLSIPYGSITKKERDIINNHALVSVKILEKLPFPQKYNQIPQIAGNHHEKLNGKGYPRGLEEKDISFEARILAITDIFEAITATNRPYKKPNSLSSSMKILYKMAQKGELDKRLVRFFYESKLYLEYAHKYLHKDQIDEVDIDMSDLVYM